MTISKLEAISKFLDVDFYGDESDENPVNCSVDDSFEYMKEEYLVLTDEEADQRAADYIRETLWAFNAKFLVNYIPAAKAAKDSFVGAIKLLQENECEACNAMLTGLIGDNIDALIEDAVSSNGRGPFLAVNDHEENEQDGYYIYRTN